MQAWTDGVTTLYGLRGPASGGGLADYVQYQTTFEATVLADAAGGTAGGNYLRFTGLTGASLTLTSLGLPDQAGCAQDGIAGLRITQVPEPLILGPLNLAPALAFRRRRRA